MAKTLESRINFMGCEIMDYDGRMIIVTTSDHLQDMGVAIAAVTSTGAVYVDEIFMSMPDDEQKFVLEHEIGHIKLGHLDKLGRWTLLLRYIKGALGIVDKMEQEADLYACKEVGYETAINALQTMHDKLVEHYGLRNKELRKRKRIIEKLNK